MPKGNLSLAFLHVDWKSLGCREGKGNATSVPHSRAPCPVGRQASEGERKEEYQVLCIPVGVVYVPSGRMNFSANLPRKPRTCTVSGRHEKLRSPKLNACLAVFHNETKPWLAV